MSDPSYIGSSSNGSTLRAMVADTNERKTNGANAGFFGAHPKTKWAAITGAVFFALVVLALALFDWNLLRPTLTKVITAKTGRQASIDGDLRVHVFSFTPSAEVNGFGLRNPAWADRPEMFSAKRITVSVSLGRLLRGQIVIPRLEFIEPVINLERDARGRASWELGSKSGTPNNDTQPSRIPTIRSLVVQDGKLHVVDQIRKLRFGGSLVAAERSGRNDESAFKVKATGTLNEKPFGLDANGGPLLDLSPDKPYSFSTHLTASDIDLVTHITVPKPFDLGTLDVKFVVSGKDLADVYYLTGLALPNTPSYRFAASVQVTGTTYTVDDLKGRLGSSDVSGKIVVQAVGKRPKLTAKLNSTNLNLVDLAPTLGHAPAANPGSLAAAQLDKGKKAAAGGTAPATAQVPPVGSDKSKDKLLPDADLQVNRVRGMDADVTYKSAKVTAPKVPMKEVSFHLVLDDGLLTIDPLAFELDEGKFAGNVRIDARKDVPVSNIDMRIENVNLAQFKTAAMKQPPLAGLLTGRFQFHGSGSSIHKLASSVNGQLSVVVPQGEINNAIAELTGINIVRGLGLLLTKNEDKTAIRCSVIDFQAHDGTLAAKTVFVDTTDVLINARGAIDMTSENMDVEMQGEPKKIRFTRLRSPITLTGTLAHPAVGLDVKKLAGQGAVAAALGTLLTPPAAILAFIDPGLAKNKDCTASLADARTAPGR